MEDPEEEQGRLTRYRDKQVKISEPHPYLSHGYSEILQVVKDDYIIEEENVDEFLVPFKRTNIESN